jgi:hypothetical protein
MRHRPAASELLAWSLVGLGLGVLAGFALGSWLGPVGPRAPRAETDRAPDDDQAPLKPAEAASAVRRVLERDQALAALDLQPIAVGPGVVELHGWVPSRALRARAVRLAAGTGGIHSLVNCLLVHGEDDASEPAPDATDLPA